MDFYPFYLTVQHSRICWNDLFCIWLYFYYLIKITCLELNPNFEWNNKIRATLQNRILSRKQKLNKSKQKSNNGEDVYTLFQSIWCHKLLLFGSFEDWVLFLFQLTHFFLTSNIHGDPSNKFINNWKYINKGFCSL